MSVRASVAMAVYQGEKFLRPQLDSILSQLGAEDELVISYDRSTDATWEIITSYGEKDPRIHIVCDPGSGVIDNFNHAFAHCSGQYIFIADQDDIWLPGKIEGMIGFLKESGAALAVHNGLAINARGEVGKEDFFSQHRIGPSLWRNFLKSRYSGCCMAFTREFGALALPIPRDIDAYDRWLGLCAEAFCHIGFFCEILIHHRFHDDNFTPTSSRSLPVILKTRLRMAKHLRRKAREIKRAR